MLDMALPSQSKVVFKMLLIFALITSFAVCFVYIMIYSNFVNVFNFPQKCQETCDWRGADPYVEFQCFNLNALEDMEFDV